MNRPARHLKLGAIGTGGIFRHAHSPALKKLDHAELVALCDINPAKCKPVHETFGIGDDCIFADAGGAADSIHSAFGEAQADGTFDVEDLATGFIRFDNGATLQVECSWASNIEVEHNFVELRGTRSGASLRDRDLKIFTESGGALCDLTPKFPSDQPGGHDLGDHGRNIQHFLDVVLHGAQPTNTPADGVHMIGILSAMYESARTGREVRLD